MSDLVKRLREDFRGCPFPSVYTTCNEAADEIERLQAENAKLRDALKRLLDFARRRLPTGNIPPQGEAAMRLLAELGDSEYVALIPQLDAYRADFPKEPDHDK